MKRTLLTLLPASLLALSAPAVASAHHGHHRRHHHHHASGARLVSFGAASSLGAGDPPTPTTENAGTVESFENGVLKIKLENGKVVEGKVTDQTELRCVSATPPTQGDDDDAGDQGGNQQGNDQQSSDQFASQHGDFIAHAAWLSDGGGDQGDDDGQESCSATMALVKGAKVRAAELEFTGAGEVWEKVIIVH